MTGVKLVQQSQNESGIVWGVSCNQEEPERRKNLGSRWELREVSGINGMQGVNGSPRESVGVNSPRVRGATGVQKSQEESGGVRDKSRAVNWGIQRPPPPPEH